MRSRPKGLYRACRCTCLAAIGCLFLPFPQASAADGDNPGQVATGAIPVIFILASANGEFAVVCVLCATDRAKSIPMNHRFTKDIENISVVINFTDEKFTGLRLRFFAVELDDQVFSA